MTTSVQASVVIPSFQSADTIAACLAGVLNQKTDGAFDVIFVDSGTDGAAALVQRDFPTVRVLKASGRLDPARARNWGARASRAPILAFIDADCVPEPDWLARLCKDLGHDSCEAIGGAIRNAERATSASWAGYFCEFREFLPTGAMASASNLTLGNAAYKRDVFVRAGGFPEGYFPQEDQVFHHQLLATGARIRFDPSIVVTHAHRSDVTSFLVHQTRIGAANARVVRALDLPGRALATRPWLAVPLLPALATYRFARTVAVCWKQERYLMLRRPGIAGLCWLGMFAWGLGFVRPAPRGAVLRRLATE